MTASLCCCPKAMTTYLWTSNFERKSIWVLISSKQPMYGEPLLMYDFRFYNYYLNTHYLILNTSYWFFGSRYDFPWKSLELTFWNLQLPTAHCYCLLFTDNCSLFTDNCSQTNNSQLPTPNSYLNTDQQLPTNKSMTFIRLSLMFCSKLLYLMLLFLTLCIRYVHVWIGRYWWI